MLSYVDDIFYFVFETNRTCDDVDIYGCTNFKSWKPLLDGTSKKTKTYLEKTYYFSVVTNLEQQLVNT
jgi:hypothetical protein